MKTYLTHIILEYRNSNEVLKRICRLLYKMAYNYPKPQEEKAQFLLAFTDRIENIVKNFVYQGYPFEVYFSSCLKWFYKTYKKNKQFENRNTMMSQRNDFWENNNDSEFTINEGTTNASEYMLKIKKRNTSLSAMGMRCLIVGLKNPDQIDDTTLHKLSDVSGVSCDTIFKYKEQLIRASKKSYERKSIIKERKNRAFYLKNLKQTELMIAESEKEKESLRAKITFYNDIILRARKELTEKHFGPRNRQIADILGIPKGTVDSAFYYFKKNFNELLLKEELQYA